jgi:hypothetical protein
MLLVYMLYSYLVDWGWVLLALDDYRDSPSTLEYYPTNSQKHSNIKQGLLVKCRHLQKDTEMEGCGRWSLKRKEVLEDGHSQTVDHCPYYTSRGQPATDPLSLITGWLFMCT